MEQALISTNEKLLESEKRTDEYRQQLEEMDKQQNTQKRSRISIVYQILIAVLPYYTALDGAVVQCAAHWTLGSVVEVPPWHNNVAEYP